MATKAFALRIWPSFTRESDSCVTRANGRPRSTSFDFITIFVATCTCPRASDRSLVLVALARTKETCLSSTASVCPRSSAIDKRFCNLFTFGERILDTSPQRGVSLFAIPPLLWVQLNDKRRTITDGRFKLAFERFVVDSSFFFLFLFYFFTVIVQFRHGRHLDETFEQHGIVYKYYFGKDNTSRYQCLCEKLINSLYVCNGCI